MIEIAARVFVFDLDDTLYLEKDFARSAFRSLSRDFGERVGGARFAEECGALLDWGNRGNIFNLALAKCGVVTTPGLIDELVAAYRAHTPEIAVCADAARFLSRMDGRMTGLITDGPRVTQSAKIGALGLSDTIDQIVVTGEWGKEFSKPHSRAFEYIESRTSFRGCDLVYIADNAAKDFIAPRLMGWQTVQILRPGRVHPGTANMPGYEAQHRISSFDEMAVAPIV
ncbi:HAD family hydrolase [Erythrobacter sp.]|uniref:HAD family hydrolase n=1 Tax=Erythrobacter sp. TaxID=1042 RepID=UPI002EADA6F4|nr:HAD family hydrolase [Erythrobacter sp.]